MERLQIIANQRQTLFGPLPRNFPGNSFFEQRTSERIRQLIVVSM